MSGIRLISGRCRPGKNARVFSFLPIPPNRSANFYPRYTVRKYRCSKKKDPLETFPQSHTLVEVTNSALVSIARFDIGDRADESDCSAPDAPVPTNRESAGNDVQSANASTYLTPIRARSNSPTYEHRAMSTLRSDSIPRHRLDVVTLILTFPPE